MSREAHQWLCGAWAFCPCAFEVPGPWACLALRQAIPCATGHLGLPLQQFTRQIILRPSLSFYCSRGRWHRGREEVRGCVWDWGTPVCVAGGSCVCLQPGLVLGKCHIWASWQQAAKLGRGCGSCTVLSSVVLSSPLMELAQGMGLWRCSRGECAPASGLVSQQLLLVCFLQVNAAFQHFFSLFTVWFLGNSDFLLITASSSHCLCVLTWAKRSEHWDGGMHFCLKRYTNSFCSFTSPSLCACVC